MNYQDFRSSGIMYLFPLAVEQTVIMAIKLNRMSVVYGSASKYSKSQINLFIRGLFYKYRFGTIREKRELRVEFFQVGL